MAGQYLGELKDLSPPPVKSAHSIELEEDSIMADQAAPWPTQGPASYFPSIERKYSRSVAQWQRIIADCGLDKHMAIVGYLKSEHQMGHGHANAIVGWTLAGNTAAP